MSDRAIPRSFAMMEGFGVHNFRFVDAKGKSCFVKFHWKPVLGEHSLVRDEAVKLAGRDTDFHRGDLWEAIDKGQYPEFEFGVQIVPELVFMLFSYTDTQLSHLGGPNFPEFPINRPMVITAGAGALFGAVA